MKSWNNVVWLIAFLFLAGLTYLLVEEKITIGIFLAISGVWMVVFLIYLVGAETIQEIRIGAAMIKRDVQAARELRKEIEDIAVDLRDFKTRMEAATEKSEQTINKLHVLSTGIVRVVLATLGTQGSIFFQIHMGRVLEMKDQLLSYLQEFEFTEDQIKELQKDFEKWVLIKHKFNIFHSIPEEEPYDQKTRKEYLKQFDNYDVSDELMIEIRKFIIDWLGDVPEETEETFKDFEYYKMNRTLRRPEIWLDDFDNDIQREGEVREE